MTTANEWNRSRKRAALITLDKRNINLQLKNVKIFILEDFVVHKKDVFAESSLAHAVQRRPPLLFRFQYAL